MNTPKLTEKGSAMVVGSGAWLGGMVYFSGKCGQRTRHELLHFDQGVPCGARQKCRFGTLVELIFVRRPPSAGAPNGDKNFRSRLCSAGRSISTVPNYLWRQPESSRSKIKMAFILAFVLIVGYSPEEPGESDKMEAGTFHLYSPNVPGQPRPRLARHVRMHGA